jgi:hypothetical protein
MKKLIMALLMFPLVASAQVLYTPNNGGGEIVLTTRPCIVKGKEYQGLKEAYSWTNRVGKLEACWTFVDGNVHVIYLSDGQVRIYPLDGFQRRD